MNRFAVCFTSAQLALAASALANTAPAVVIKSATMRGATGLMDVVFRVNDPDDATVKTRALAFIDGQRSFAKVIKPTTFAEGTGAKLGDAIASNTDHTLTWNVATDWNTDLGQIKFEILAMDGRGLLPLNWVTIPAANGQPELTISKNAPTDQEVLDALFWQYASGDPGLVLESGVLKGSSRSGVFSAERFAIGSSIQFYGTPYIFDIIGIAPAETAELNLGIASRALISDRSRWHGARPYEASDIIHMWGNNSNGQSTPSTVISRNEIVSIAAGSRHNIALNKNGTVMLWGYNQNGQLNAPQGLADVEAISAGTDHSLALKTDGTVVSWGWNTHGQTVVPVGLADVVSVSGGSVHSLALRKDGSVVAWGADNNPGIADVPAGLSDVKAIAAGQLHSLALKNDGTVVAWGAEAEWNAHAIEMTPPAGLSDVKAISAGRWHSLALKNDGTVVAWGDDSSGQSSVPENLTNVVSISAGNEHSLALKLDGTVVAWGGNYYGQKTVPSELAGVSYISAGVFHTLALKKAPRHP
jgi:hypothetical protein